MSLDQALAILSDEERRNMITTLKDAENQEMSYRDIIENMDEEYMTLPKDQMPHKLHHHHIPMIEEYGAIETLKNTVYYKGDELLEELHDAVEEIEV